MVKKNIQPSQAENYTLSGIVAFSIAEPGACGVPGEVIILTEDSKAYRLNYLRGKWTPETLKKLSPVIANARLGIFGQNDCVPGWKAVYLGLGNHLFLADSYYGLFSEKAKEEHIETKGELYQQWQDIIQAVLIENHLHPDGDAVVPEYSPINPSIEHNINKMFDGPVSISDLLEPTTN